MRVLLTGSRAPATLELARLCAQAGHEVHVADTHAWDVCRGSKAVTRRHRLPAPRDSRSAYAAAVRSIVSTHHIDVIVPTCEEVFHLAAHRDDLGARVACEPLHRLAPLHDKWQFVAQCAESSVAAPRSTLLRERRELDTLPPGEYVIKARHSRFATQVRRWHTGSPLPIGVDVTSGRWIAQSFQHGTPLCSWSVAVDGVLASHATYAVDATAGRMGAAISFHSVRHHGVVAWVRQFVAHHRLTGQFAFDFIDSGDTLCAIECNPRLTSGIHCFRGQPVAIAALVDPGTSHQFHEAPAGRAFSSRLAMLSYGKWLRGGESLLAAANDPWPRRLQLYTWLRLLTAAARAGVGPRAWSTRDIEWNGE